MELNAAPDSAHHIACSPMDAAAAAQALHDAIVGLENVVITRYISAAGFVVLLYDHLLTLDDEVQYVWAAPNTTAKILFLVLRYMVPIFLTATTVTRSGLPVIPMSDIVCKIWISSTTYAGWLSIVISNLLVLLRIWTTLPRGHRFIIWSMYFFVVMQLMSLGVTTWVITNMIPVLVFEPLVGLCTFNEKPNVVGLWLPGLAFEVVVFGTVCWNVLDRPRSVGIDSQEGKITRVLARDGVLYFVVISGLRVANTVIAIVAPISSLFIIVFFIWAGTTVTTSRLIINSRREAGEREKMAQLEELVVYNAY
ncbi:hypothetical protein B0H16DRAFT_1896895 [Mycena metata]|uniref:DUF6533 domain-containing protein n=1 Tax=Mycena metata TaxID=1033252 RepID=A0AAD7HH28_9AGAR|nr:hypothetical protein B0H16DRAFT_1896895 [Mycena metata]